MVLFILGRLAGASLFDNGWSFAHWDAIPLWYVIGWFVAAAAIAHSASTILNLSPAFLTGAAACLQPDWQS